MRTERIGLDDNGWIRRLGAFANWFLGRVKSILRTAVEFSWKNWLGREECAGVRAEGGLFWLRKKRGWGGKVFEGRLVSSFGVKREEIKRNPK